MQKGRQKKGIPTEKIPSGKKNLKNYSSYGNSVELFWYNQDRQAYSSVFVSSLTVPYRRIERDFSMGGGKCVLDNDNRSRSALIALRNIYAVTKIEK